MTPEQIAKAGTESAHQQALFCWCAWNVGKYPELKWFHAIPNGGSRGDSAQSRSIRGAKLKAEGVKAGVADTFLPVKRAVWSGLYVEMKRHDGKASVEQKEFRAFVESQGFKYVMCYSWDGAANMLEWYLSLK